MRHAIALIAAGLLPLSSVSAAGQISTPAKHAVQDPGVLAFFKDTGAVTIFSDARVYRLARPGQRDSLHSMVRRERAVWRARGPQKYRFLLRAGCFCPAVRGWLLIEVRPGKPLRAWNRTGTPAPLTDWDTISIDGLFDYIERSTDANVAVQLKFDPKLHFPTYVYTSGARAPDTWSVMEARALRPL